MLDHPNCINIIETFYTHDEEKDETYCCIVSDYVPSTVYNIVK